VSGEERSSKLAKVVYRPVGLIGGLAAGALSGIIVKQVWKRVAKKDDAPQALQSEYSLTQIILAAALQGLVFAVVKALIDRGGARAFQRVTGEWPGD
jgi:F0F1-type ATP synthase membrane subunit c/vacuolar-type H+-ATPase subunit K